MRVPAVYSASEIVNWNVSEQYAPGKWRPSRNCGFSGWGHWRTRLRITWLVFTGQLDAINWGETSGDVSADIRGYKDCTEAEFLSATRVHEPPEGM